MINSPQYREFAGLVAAIFWINKTTHSVQSGPAQSSLDAVALQDSFNKACIGNRYISHIYIYAISEFIPPLLPINFLRPISIAAGKLLKGRPRVTPFLEMNYGMLLIVPMTIYPRKQARVRFARSVVILFRP